YHPAVVINQDGQQNSGDPRPRCAPAKPEQRARHQLRIHDFLRRTVEFGLERAIDPVEEVEMTDPDDSDDDVRPAEDELKPVVYVGIHCALLAPLTASLSPRRGERVQGEGPTAAGFAVACAARIICPSRNSKTEWPSSPAHRAESAARQRNCSSSAARASRFLRALPAN